MADLIRVANDIRISYKTFTITYRIQTGDRRYSRWYADVIRYPAYKITELQEADNKSRSQYENESIERTKKYCESRGEVVYNWVITDKDNRKR